MSDMKKEGHKFKRWLNKKCLKRAKEEEIGLFDVIKSLLKKEYDPFKRNQKKCRCFFWLTGGACVGWFFMGVDVVLTGIITIVLCCQNKLDFQTVVPSCCLDTTGMSLIGILLGANFVVFSILCTAQLFNAEDMSKDKRKTVAEGVAYICIQLLLAFICYILPLFNIPEGYSIMVQIFSILYLIFIAINIMFHIFALIIYNIHDENMKKGIKE